MILRFEQPNGRYSTSFRQKWRATAFTVNCVKLTEARPVVSETKVVVTDLGFWHYGMSRNRGRALTYLLIFSQKVN